MKKKRIVGKPQTSPPSIDQWVNQGGIDPEIQPAAPEPTIEEPSEGRSKPFPHRVSFDMASEQYDRFDFASFKTKQSKNQILREALEDWMKARGY